MSRTNDLESGQNGCAIRSASQPTAAAAASKKADGGNTDDDDDSVSSTPTPRKFSEAESVSSPNHRLKSAPKQTAPDPDDSEEASNVDDDDDGGGDRSNLDSGYAWCILAVMFLIQSSISGSSRVYGVVYAKEVAIGYYDRESASWPIATASAVENLTSILTPALASYLSWRKIELLSTCLFISSNLIAYFSSSLAVDIVALGLIQGLALATSTPLSLAINNDYFERYRTTAYGISMSGSTFGVLYLTPLIGWLLATYEDFRLVYLALAGVFSVNILLVLFIKPRAKTINNGDEGTTTTSPAAEKTKELFGGEQNGANKKGLTMAAQHNAAQLVNCLQAAKNSSISRAPRNAADAIEIRRKRSRLESQLFERKASIASISYSVRSRRQSILSRTTNFDQQQLATIAQAIDGNTADGPINNTKPRRVFSQRECSLDQQADDKPLTGDGREGAADTSKPGLAKSFSIGANLFFKAHNNSKKTSVCSVGSNDSALFAAIDGSKNNNNNTDAGEQGDKWKHKTLARQASNNAVAAQLYKQHSIDGLRELEADELNREISMTLAQLNECSAARDKIVATKQIDKSVHRQRGGGDEFSLGMISRLIRVPYLHCVWIMLALYYLIARVFIIILVDFADDHGFSLSESTSLLNYWSLGELFGRVFLGSLIDLNWMSCKTCITLTCLLLTGAIVLMVMVESYLVYAACSLLIAALISLEYMLINVLMVEYLGKRCVTSCYSLAACISSIVLFSRPSLIGLFRDHLGSYDGLLLLLAACTFTYAVLFQLLEPLLVRKWPKLAPI